MSRTFPFGLLLQGAACALSIACQGRIGQTHLERARDAAAAVDAPKPDDADPRAADAAAPFDVPASLDGAGRLDAEASFDGASSADVQPDAPPPRFPRERAEVTIPAGHDLVTLVVDDERGRRVRNLVSMGRVADLGGDPTSGAPQTLTVMWDGRDDDGRSVPAGDYLLRGLSLPTPDPRYEYSWYNPGTPPTMSRADPLAGWGADHGDVVALAAPPASAATKTRVVMGVEVAEYGYHWFAVDDSGRKTGGEHGWGFQSATAMAFDGKWLLQANGDKLRRIELDVWTAAGPPLAFTATIHSVAVKADAVAVALRTKPTTVVFVDKASGVQRPVPLPGVDDPAYVAFGADGALYASTIQGLKRVGADGLVTAVALPGLSGAPGPLTIDGAGSLYVVDRGPERQVKVYDRSLQLVRRIGRTGGRASAAYDPTALPAGADPVKALAIDARGWLWTSEGSLPRRQALWAPVGEGPADGHGNVVVKEFIGTTWFGLSGVTMHDQSPTTGGIVDLEFELDPAAGTYRPTAFVGPPAPASGPRPASPPLFNRPQRFRSAASGRAVEYKLDVSSGYPILSVLRGGAFRPVAALWRKGQVRDNPSRSGDSDQMVYLWSDANGDEAIATDELLDVGPHASAGGHWVFSLGPSLAWYVGGVAIAPASFLDSGAPVYTRSPPHWQPLALEPLFDQKGGAIPLDHVRASSATEVGNHVVIWVNDEHQGLSFGAPEWGRGRFLFLRKDGSRVAHLLSRHHFYSGDVNPGVQPPGVLAGEGNVCGTADLGAQGSVFALCGYFGQMFLLTEDGLYVSHLFRSGNDPARVSYGSNPVRGASWKDHSLENGSAVGWFGRHSDGKVRVITGRTEVNVLQVDGLERLVRFPPVTLTH